MGFLKDKKMNRRTALQIVSVGAGGFILSSCSTSSKTSEVEVPPVDPSAENNKIFQRMEIDDSDIGPIDRTFGEIAPLQFSGEQPDSSHQILWDIPGFISRLGEIPAPSEKSAVVVVGGGMSGMLSAYRLKKYVPIVLESSDRFGGNSRGESWHDLDYSIGAANLKGVKEGSSLDTFLREIDVSNKSSSSAKEDFTLLNGKIFLHFMKGDTDFHVAGQAEVLDKYFTDVFNEKNGKVFPQIPPVTPAQTKIVNELDGISFRDHLKKILNTDTIYPHLDVWLEHYCWLKFGSSAREVSAAVGVNQMAGEFVKVETYPGGNAFVAEKLYRKLRRAVGEGRLRTRCVVFQVKITDEGALVSYEQEGRVKTILAETVVMACAKNVAARIIPEFPAEREKIIRRYRYNSVLVANLMLNKKSPQSFYQINNLGDGKLDFKDIQGNSERHRVTRIVNATFSYKDYKKEEGLLTLYRPLPYLEGKAQIYSSGSYFKARKEFIDQIEKEILPALGIPAQAIIGLRLARWGHALPVSMQGLIKDGSLELVMQPLKDRIYFINQDNWLNPCFETLFGDVQKWTPIIEKSILNRRSKKVRQDDGADKNTKGNEASEKNIEKTDGKNSKDSKDTKDKSSADKKNIKKK